MAFCYVSISCRWRSSLLPPNRIDLPIDPTFYMQAPEEARAEERAPFRVSSGAVLGSRKLLL